MAQRRVLAPAEPAELNLDLAGWYRRGGRRCTVHVTAEEFAAAVRAGLIEEFGPWSPTLTRSHPPLTAGREYESICSLNGFLLIQDATAPMYYPAPRRATTRDICVVDAVYANSGELVTYPHYLSVWRRIARRLRKTADRPGPPHGHPLSDGYPWSTAALAEALTAMDQGT